MFVVLSALASSALAAPSAQQVIAALQDTAGWSAPSQTKGVAVSTKKVAGLSVPAFRGQRTVDVSCDAYFANVSDPSRHQAVNSMLRASRVVKKDGDTVVFYQVLDVPLLSDRYWINGAKNERNIGGQAGHDRQTWWAEQRDDYPEIRDAVEKEYSAVFTEVNYGFWDLVPAGDGSCTVTYAVVSDPGGSIPSSAGSWASEKSLPANINSFYEAAKR